MKPIILITTVLLFLMNANCHAQQDEAVHSLGGDNALYLGVKIGLPYLLGVDAGYLIADEKRVKVYLNGSIQSIIIFSSVNLGAGYFIGRKGFSLGLRYSRYAHIEETFSNVETGSLVMPELGWFKAVGRSKNTIISLQLGTAGLNFSAGFRVF